MATSTVTVKVPATTANIGPGFDCLGAALTLYNQFHFRTTEGKPGELTIQVKGSEATRVSTGSNNLVYKAFSHLFHHIQRPVPAVTIEIDLGVPLARGLGSSSTAIVGGLVGANCLTEQPLSQSALVEMAVTIEGHPDNVVPALLGGCQLAVMDNGRGWTLCDIPWHPSVIPVVGIPNFELATETARRVLPATYSRADAIFNTAHLGLLQRGLSTGNGDWLKVALGDRIHQPYRKTLIPGYNTVAAAALEAGAYGLVISGAGPTLLALAPEFTATTVAHAMQTAWSNAGQTVTTHTLKLSSLGTEVF